MRRIKDSFQKDGFVAAELKIIGALAHGGPHERIEPAHGRAERQEEFRRRVAAGDMDDLMPQDERQLLLRILAHGQHDAGRPVIQADGQRRRDRVGAHELPLAFPDPLSKCTLTT